MTTEALGYPSARVVGPPTLSGRAALPGMAGCSQHYQHSPIALEAHPEAQSGVRGPLRKVRSCGPYPDMQRTDRAMRPARCERSDVAPIAYLSPVTSQIRVPQLSTVSVPPGGGPMYSVALQISVPLGSSSSAEYSPQRARPKK